MQDWNNIQNSKNVTQHISIIKEKTRMITAIGAEQSFDRTQHS